MGHGDVKSNKQIAEAVAQRLMWHRIGPSDARERGYLAYQARRRFWCAWITKKGRAFLECGACERSEIYLEGCPACGATLEVVEYVTANDDIGTVAPTP